MPTVNLSPQADGLHGQWFNITGADFAYQAVDDSTGVTHDSDASFFDVGPGALGPNDQSFQFFDGSEGITPVSLTINVAARKEATKGALVYRIGLFLGAVFAASGAAITTVDSYVVSSRTFTSNPFSAAPWAEDDLRTMEIGIRSDSGFGAISLVSASLEYVGQHMPGVLGLEGAMVN